MISDFIRLDHGDQLGLEKDIIEVLGGRLAYDAKMPSERPAGAFLDGVGFDYHGPELFIAT
jgi:hypothetical protein